MPVIEYKLQGDSKSLVGATDSAATSMAGATAAASALIAGVAALGAAYLDLVSSTVEVVDQVNTLSKATGLSTESINALRLRAVATGKELTDLVPKRLAKNMLAAQQGSKALADAFKELEVDIEDEAGLRDINDVLPELIDSLQGMENQTKAAGLASVVGGKQMEQMLSAFDDSEGFEQFVELGNEFGIKTGPEAVAAASEWQAATANLALAFEDMGARALGVLGGTGALASAIDDVSLALVFMGEFTTQIADKMLGNFQAIGDAISNLLAGNFEAAADSAARFEAGIGPIDDALQAATERAFTFWELQQKGAADATEAGDAHFKSIQDRNRAIRAGEDAAKAAAATEKERAAAAKQAAEDEAQFMRDIAQLEADLAAESLATKEAMIEEERALRQSAADYQLSLIEQMDAVEQQKREAANIAIDAGLQTSLAGVDLLLQAQIGAAEANAGASKKEQRAKARAIKRTFAAQQGLALASIAMDSARAILSLIPSFSFLGPGAPLAAAGVVTPAAAIQTAVVLSQKPPKFHDGTANVDEVLATLKADEAVLNQRGAESIGRERIDRANRGEPIGGGMISQIVFQGRVLDEMMSQVLQGGGPSSRIIGAGRPPAGTLDPYGGI